ncbi:hypothetical protein [Flavicella sediminum]|uniref:hypothetical protein n=1 Tax=Flavicella sediminum TaxID=2585141 RepID=UPI0011200329|nr:hypothetical protein [Flavicella sediminum]
MKKTLFLLFVLLSLNINYLIGQNSILKLNNLPPTIEVNAPEFKTEKIYHFKIDTFQNNLIIQDLRKSKNNEIHFYQWIYEIPLKNLNDESFKLSKDRDQINIKIKPSSPIMHYMFQDGKISYISMSNSLFLGKWNYSDSLYTELVEQINFISSSLPSLKSKPIQDNMIHTKFKYLDKNIKTVDANIIEDTNIGNGYYFKQIPEKLKSKIIKLIKKKINQKNINHQYPILIIVYSSKEGIIESVFIGNQTNEKSYEINLNQLNSSKQQSLKKPTKYLFLLE